MILIPAANQCLFTERSGGLQMLFGESQLSHSSQIFRFQYTIIRLATDLKRPIIMGMGRTVISLLFCHFSQVRQANGFAHTIPDLTTEGQRLLKTGARRRAIISDQGQFAQAGEILQFPSMISKALVQGKRLLIIRTGQLIFALVLRDISQAGERMALLTPIAEGAIHRQRLREVGMGGSKIALYVRHHAQIVQGAGYASFVSQLPANRQALLKVLARRSEIAAAPEQVSGGVQRRGTCCRSRFSAGALKRRLQVLAALVCIASTPPELPQALDHGQMRLDSACILLAPRQGSAQVVHLSLQPGIPERLFRAMQVLLGLLHKGEEVVSMPLLNDLAHAAVLQMLGRVFPNRLQQGKS